MNLEDETGMVNVLCSPGVWARHRKLAQTASALLIRGHRAERHRRGHRRRRPDGPHRLASAPLPGLPLSAAKRHAPA